MVTVLKRIALAAPVVLVSPCQDLQLFERWKANCPPQIGSKRDNGKLSHVVTLLLFLNTDLFHISGPFCSTSLSKTAVLLDSQTNPFPK